MKGHVEKRNGARGTSWRVRIELPRDENGGRRSRSYTYTTKKEAERELARLLRELDTGQWADPAQVTVGEYLRRWLEDAAKVRVGRRTYERYEAILRLHVLPNLGDLPLAKLRPLHLQRLYAQLQQAGMSAAGVGKVHQRLHTALRQAVRWQMLPYNPADGLELPSVRRREVRALTESETARLLRAAQQADGQRRTRMFAPLVLAVSTGMRRGELLGLRWCDVDLEGAALSVVQVLEESGQGVSVKPPKTARSRRRVTLPPFAVAALRAHRVAQDQERLRAGASWRGGDFVFAAVGGGPWIPSNFDRAFRAVLTRTGGEDESGREIPPLVCRFHDLRHTHASQLLRLGTHAKVVSERLGHANIGITLDLYSHVLPGLQEEAVERWDAAITTALAATPQAALAVPKRSPRAE